MASEAPNLPARPSAMDKDVSIPRRFSNDPYPAFFFPTVLCGPDDVQEKLGLELPEERRVEGFLRKYPTARQWGPFSVGYNFKVAGMIASYLTGDVLLRTVTQKCVEHVTLKGPSRRLAVG